jgi:hypothetical protein
MTLARPMFPPVDSTRRRFLSQAAGVAAGSAVLALAMIQPVSAVAAPASTLDPVFGLIEAHRTAQAAYLVALAEHTRLDRLGDPDAYLISEAPCDAQNDAFSDLIETAPTTFAGLVAWATYLDQFRQVEAWMFEETATVMLETLVEALGNLAVTS